MLPKHLCRFFDGSRGRYYNNRAEFTSYQSALHLDTAKAYLHWWCPMPCTKLHCGDFSKLALHAYRPEASLGCETAMGAGNLRDDWPTEANCGIE